MSTIVMAAFRQYICRVCGWIYDEAQGDPDSGLAPGTRFEDIPEDWACPLCGVTRADLVPYEPAPVGAFVATESVAPSRTPGVVIVGAGTAGWAVAQRLRALDPALPITLVTGCDGDAYHKPELSVALSRGIDADALRREPGAAQAARLGVRLEAGCFATGIDPAARRLRTTAGTLRYSHLVLALGATPRSLPTLPNSIAWRINSLPAWTALRARLGDTHKRILVVGSGLVGCELAEDAARAGHQVTLLNRGATPMDEMLPPLAGERLASRLEALGIAMVYSDEVAQAERAGDLSRITTRQGRVLEADVVISAVGLVTDLRLARMAGLTTDAAIAVDAETLRTSDPAIFALGDCVSIDGRPCRYIAPIAAQADAIAHAIRGLPHPGYRHLPPPIRLKSRALPITIEGQPEPMGDWRVLEQTERRLTMEQRRGGATVARLVA